MSNSKILRKYQDMKLFVGNQSDKGFLKKVAKSGPFDLIVDDGSHLPKDAATSLQCLWPSIAKQGWYAIEDVWFKKKYFPDRPILMHTVQNMINDMCINNDVCTVSFFPNICFIQKNG